MAQEMETIINIAGNLDASLQKAIDAATSRIEEMQDVIEQASGAYDSLSDTILDQGDALRDAQREYANYVLRGDESTEQAEALADRIRDLSGDLQRNRDAMEAAQKAAQRIADGMDDYGDAAKRASSLADSLSDTIGDQGDELKKAKQRYMDYVLAGEKNSKEAREQARYIERLSGEIRDNERRMKAAEEAADRLAGELDDMGDAARDSGDGFTVMRGALADFISDGVQDLVSGAADAVGSLYGLADETREFRQDMGTLETAFDSAGHTAATATGTWRELYAVFGEDDRAVEAANNIARMADDQQELDKWVKITTGVWGTYQDALPVEGLAEAAGETAKVGKVTGVMADALNWSSEAAAMFADYMSEDVTTAEDAFNVALSKATTEAERQALITDTLTKLYGGAAEQYGETAGSLMEANRAAADFSLAQAELGERIEPVTSAVRGGFGRILDKVLELTEDVDFAAFADRVSGAFDTAVQWMDKIPGTVEKASEAVGTGIAWVKDNADWLVPVVGGLATAFGALEIASLAAKAISAVSSALSVLSGPAGWIALTAAGVIWLYQNWDTAKTKVEEFGAKVSEIWDGISQWIGGAIDRVGQLLPIWGAYLEGMWSSVQDAIGNVKAIFSGLIDFVSNIFAGNWSDAWTNVTDIFGNVFGMLGNIAKGPINGVISIVNRAIESINSIGFTVPDWIPEWAGGGKTFAINIPEIPMLYTGGFTDGVSIAGERATEAVISFDKRYRSQNIGYWAEAGRALGVEDTYLSQAGRGIESGAVTLEGGGYTETVFDFSGMSFSPQITVTGTADKNDLMEQLEQSESEFVDFVEEVFRSRMQTVYT